MEKEKTKELPLLTTETIDWDGSVKKIENKLICGDNLSVMRALPGESIDLIYIDPPFFSGRNYNCIFGDDDEVRSFKDIWDGGMPTYLAWLNARLWEMKRLLKSDGSIFVHLDWHACHYVKVELDKIFGYENLVDDIAWCYSGSNNTKKTLPKKHDTILHYAKSPNYKFNYKEILVEPRSTARYYTDQNGRKYTKKDGKIYYCKNDGKIPEDYWVDIQRLHHISSERIGYPTQKPEQLVERIVKMASDPGDVVADFFSGGGTTVAVAEKLDRKWVGCDISRTAVSVARDRLLDVYTKDAGIKRIQEKPKFGFYVYENP